MGIEPSIEVKALLPLPKRCRLSPVDVLALFHATPNLIKECLVQDILGFLTNPTALVNMQKFPRRMLESWNSHHTEDGNTVSFPKPESPVPQQPTLFSAALSVRTFFLYGQLELPSLHFLLSIAVLLL